MVTFNQGDIVYLDFDPQSGHEQKGRRPAIVVSKSNFNKLSSLNMVCPISHTARRYPTYIELPAGMKTDGVILCDQARFLDLNSRNAAFVEAAPKEIIQAASDMIIALVELDG